MSVGRLGGTGPGPEGLSGDEIVKPEAPATREVEKDLDRLALIISRMKKPDGSLDVAKLRKEVAGTRDPDLANALEAIVERFQRTETRPAPAATYTSSCGGGSTYASSCGGTPSSSTVEVDPKTLERGEVAQVLADLRKAREGVGDLDRDRDGKLSKTEIDATPGRGGLSSELIQAALQDYGRELESWGRALAAVASSLDARTSLDEKILAAASHHAATPQGAAAIAAAYRDLITQGGQLPDLEATLAKAEGGCFARLLGNLGLFGHPKAGHLDDAEVRKLLDTQDLRQFAADRYASIKARTGGEYQKHFLKGKDLKGAGQLEDPDFKKGGFRSGCS